MNRKSSRSKNTQETSLVNNCDSITVSVALCNILKWNCSGRIFILSCFDSTAHTPMKVSNELYHRLMQVLTNSWAANSKVLIFMFSNNFLYSIYFLLFLINKNYNILET